MNSICPDIDIAIKLALIAGNKIKKKSEGWNKAKQVFFMEKNLTQELKNNILTEIPKLASVARMKRFSVSSGAFRSIPI